MKRIKLLLLFCLVFVLVLTGCESVDGESGSERYAENGLEYKVNPDGKTCTIVSIGNCTDTVVTVPKTIDGYQVTVIGENAFCAGNWSACDEVTEILLPEGLLTIEDNAFSESRKLTKVHLPSTVTEVGTWVFQNCIGLTDVTIPPSLKKIGVHMFLGCVALEEITIPEGVEVIGGAAFMGCSSLKSIALPDSVTIIEEGAFSASGIQTLSLGSGVESIGTMLVHFCENLTDVYYNGTLAEWKQVGFDGWMGGETLHCTDAVFLTGEGYQ